MSAVAALVGSESGSLAAALGPGRCGPLAEPSGRDTALRSGRPLWRLASITQTPAGRVAGDPQHMPAKPADAGWPDLS